MEKKKQELAQTLLTKSADLQETERGHKGEEAWTGPILGQGGGLGESYLLVKCRSLSNRAWVRKTLQKVGRRSWENEWTKEQGTFILVQKDFSLYSEKTGRKSIRSGGEENRRWDYTHEEDRTAEANLFWWRGTSSSS